MDKREDRIFINFIYLGKNNLNKLLIYFGKAIIEKLNWKIDDKLCMDNPDNFKNLFIKKCDNGVLIRDLRRSDPLVCVVEFKMEEYPDNYNSLAIEAQYEYSKDGIILSLE